ncbi:DUF1501 domain-containing protein [Sphingomonas sp. AP4-R1]|uniref:DUF1501 domain-containing protein n=1 Tax=Sphingomonas sp. AP4-R1 TaxID=2735134 RepID=UPI00149394B6|nr:DUF1501 domain-containing protein [Sphingomonas sp. AP4-R1]QJU57678.1 DUF1501 domain-containing protein [Sphingomonas sp. AP4-R1]
MDFSRRDFAKLLAGAGVSAAFCQLGRSAAIAAPVSGYKAMVGIFLFGGNDGWNMVVPTDSTRYAAYAATRVANIVLPQANLTPLAGSTYGLHPSLAPLKSVWDEGGLNVVLNAGTLFQPLTKAQYNASPNLRPVNLMSHADEQAHWQGLRARDINVDGFMGRLSDRAAQASIPSLISFGGSQLAMLGKSTSPLVLPSSGLVSQYGTAGNSADPVVFARANAVSAFADGAGQGAVTQTTATGLSSAYAQAVQANTILSATSTVDQYFTNPTTGAALTSDVARQLMRVARMIEARSTLGQSRQTFFVTHGGYDTHANQISVQGALFTDLANAMLGFNKAMKALGLNENVTCFTMSDFGRVYKGNAQGGSDHAWGNNHLVMGGALKPKQVIGTYPSQVMGGVDDVSNDGRFIPTISQEEYIGAIARWHGVADADLPYVFPNWATFNGGGRGPLGLFQG